MPGGLGDVADNLGSQLGMINALRTGNPLLDMAICMLIPVFFQMLVQFGQHLQPVFNKLLAWMNSGGEFYTRAIEFECRTTPWGSVIRTNGKEERNNILQKALILYICDIKGVEYRNAKVSLMAVSEKGKRDDDSYEMVYGSTADQLGAYNVNIVPPSGTWVTLRENLEFMQNNEEENNEGKEGKSDGPRKNVTTYHFKTPIKFGEKVIEGFIQEAFDWYVAKVKSNQDHGRYLYMLLKNVAPSSAEKEEGSDSGSRIYKRYRLSGEKTFMSMFFKEKQMMLKLLGHFEKKTGKYAIKGFPHKLGLLLHGPPGTGKTSLIKALAEHTGRSVVSISLSRIETNQELMDIVFDQSFLIKGEDMPVKLGFKDIIFVMEDVDAASPIVHARAAGDREGEVGKSVPVVKLQRQVTAGGTEAAAGGETKNETIEVCKPAGEAAAAQGDLSDGDLVTALLTSLSDPAGTDGKKATAKYFSSYDKLDLSGLLNVLDGVVDCPNRILVMTTNHPEKLDPALIRPGRIDKIVYLGYMQPAEAFQMVEHYFQTPLTASQKERIEGALSIPLKSTPSAFKMYGDKGFTPAELEQLCAEYDDIDEFLTNLEDRVLENSAVDAPPDLERLPTAGSGAGHAPVMRRGLSTGKN
jgi:chaperone BCS1